MSCNWRRPRYSCNHHHMLSFSHHAQERQRQMSLYCSSSIGMLNLCVYLMAILGVNCHNLVISVVFFLLVYWMYYSWESFFVKTDCCCCCGLKHPECLSLFYNKIIQTLSKRQFNAPKLMGIKPVYISIKNFANWNNKYKIQKHFNKETLSQNGFALTWDGR